MYFRNRYYCRHSSSDQTDTLAAADTGFCYTCAPILVVEPQVPINFTAVKTCSHMHLWLMHLSSTCTDEWCPTASIHCPLSLPCKKSTMKLSLNYAQNKIQNAQSQRMSWLYWWLFQTQHIPRWKERKKNNSDFDHFRLATLEQFLCTVTATRLGQPIHAVLKVLVNTNICCKAKLLEFFLFYYLAIIVISYLIFLFYIFFWNLKSTIIRVSRILTPCSAL